MLPLDRLTKEAELGLQSHGVSADSLTMALQLDMDIDGRFGETWLCTDRDGHLYIMSATGRETDSPRVTSTLVDENLKRKHKTPKQESAVSADTFRDCSFQTFDIAALEGTYIDNFVTSERLLSKIDGVTTVLAQSTNARKQKMFAFVDLMERIREGREIAED
ncbi:MAG: hypothetical protein IJ302_06730, partial [Clostridia bacterium]|nr:hypothetical protein [Clostridia bacterium]